MNNKLLTTALVLVIVAMLLWIVFELLPTASQNVGTAVQQAREESETERATRESIELVRSDTNISRKLTSLGSVGGEQYAVTSIEQDGSMFVEIRFNDTSGVSHVMLVNTFQGKVGYHYQLDGGKPSGLW